MGGGALARRVFSMLNTKPIGSFGFLRRHRVHKWQMNTPRTYCGAQ